MSRELTEEELAEVDRIIAETEVEYDWFSNGEDSMQVPSADDTLLTAARRVRAYLKTLK